MTRFSYHIIYLFIFCLTLNAKLFANDKITASQPQILAEQGYTKQFKKNFKQSHLSCAIITSEHLTTLQLFQRGLPKAAALKSLPNISREARKRVDYVYDLANSIGILNAYSDINTNFSRCSTLVHQVKGRPAADLKERDYYFCSGENKLRFEIILLINQNRSLDNIYSKIPVSHYLVARNYAKLIDNKGILAAFDLTANNLKACLNLIE